jgi:hypothetical protein
MNDTFLYKISNEQVILFNQKRLEIEKFPFVNARINRNTEGDFTLRIDANEKDLLAFLSALESVGFYLQ